MVDGQPRLGAWITRIGYGSEEHFKRVYDASSAKLFAVCLKITGNPALAEEAVKNCFVTIWHTAASYNDTELEPDAWLIAIARKEAIALANEHRAADATEDEQMRSDISAEVSKSGLFDYFRSPTRFGDTDDSRHGFDAMNLIYRFGMTYRTAARYFGADHNELKSLVHRELLKVRGL